MHIALGSKSSAMPSLAEALEHIDLSLRGWLDDELHIAVWQCLKILGMVGVSLVSVPERERKTKCTTHPRTTSTVVNLVEPGKPQSSSRVLAPFQVGTPQD